MTEPADGSTKPGGTEEAPEGAGPLEDLFPAKSRGRVFAAVAIVLLMANLNAMVDSILHPEIPYFDAEHMIVGGVTGFVTALLLVLVFLYIHRLERTAQEITTLRGLLPICAMCKKIRGKDNRWYPVERYVSEHSDASFTHGLCPECGAGVMEGLKKRKAQG